MGFLYLLQLAEGSWRRKLLVQFKQVGARADGSFPCGRAARLRWHSTVKRGLHGTWGKFKFQHNSDKQHCGLKTTTIKKKNQYEISVTI